MAKFWINPDCGLKTRGIKETKESLIKLVNAAKEAREHLYEMFRGTFYHRVEGFRIVPIS